MKALLLVLLVSNALIQFGSSVTLFSWTIQLTNRSRNTTLVTECQANGKPIGARSIHPESDQAFLCDVIVKKRSVATCDLRLGDLHGRFDVFDSKRDLRRCKDKACLWVVNEIGLSVFLGPLLEFQYGWP